MTWPAGGSLPLALTARWENGSKEPDTVRDVVALRS